jgi:DNA polymerase III epsilon subunit-like protein
MIIRCLDIETTGLDATKDAMVEIASVDLRRDGTIISTAETLCSQAWRCPRLPVASTTSSTLT